VEDTQKIDLLIESLKHPEKKVIRQAAERLIAMAPQVPELAPKLNRLLTITPDQYRWPIAYVLARISPPSPPCLEVLKETLGSGDSDIRWAAAVLLVRLGNADKGVTALLRDLLRTGTPTQRRMAVYCIRDSDQNQACVEALLDSLRDPDPLVRVASVTSLKLPLLPSFQNRGHTYFSIRRGPSFHTLCHGFYSEDTQQVEDPYKCFHRFCYKSS